MEIVLVKITPAPQHRQEALEILRHVEGPTSVNLDCIMCAIYERFGEDPTLLYMEQWKTLTALRRHIQSSMFTNILAAMEMSAIPPEIHFFETARTWGLELVESLRRLPEKSDRSMRQGETDS